MTIFIAALLIQKPGAELARLVFWVEDGSQVNGGGSHQCIRPKNIWLLVGSVVPPLDSTFQQRNQCFIRYRLRPIHKGFGG